MPPTPIAVGGGIVDEAVALGIAREAGPRIHDLLAYGVPFDRDLEGRLAVGREAAHSARRIVHVRGDGAGAAIIAALSEAVRRTPSIRVIEGFVAEALLTEDGAVTGLQLREAGNFSARPTMMASRAVVLATGGIGHLYGVTTNPVEASGSGLAIAARGRRGHRRPRNSCSSTRPRSWSAAIRRRSRPRRCAAKARY